MDFTEVYTFAQCLVTWEIESTCLVVSSQSLVSFICVKYTGKVFVDADVRDLKIVIM